MNAILTLDYELFMSNKTGTPQKCLFEPMKALTKLLDKFHIKANIFVDAAYILRLQELQEKCQYSANDFDLVCQHIKSLSEQGHDIQLHFHPQWLYSTRGNDGKWSMDFSHYKLSDCDNDFINSSLYKGGVLLQSLSNNQIKAFRAGGYSIMDFPRYSKTLKKLGITIDSSVLTGAVSKTRFQEYDYKNIKGGGEKSLFIQFVYSKTRKEWVFHGISNINNNSVFVTLFKS